ncbi:MAG: integrase domain-containing protein [Azoarcus sp.]|jgi:integrase|nr:integrase domain-containing protein [Azoarcus sp.]
MLTSKFSKTTLNALQPDPAGKRLTIYDTEIPKLAITVTGAGTKTFYVIKRVASKIAWLKLGRYPEMSVDQARLAAIKVLGEIVDGVDPVVARQNMKGELTLSEFFDAEYGPRCGEKKLSWKDDQQRFCYYLKQPLGGLKLSEIQRTQIATVLSDATKAGKAVATVRSIRALASHILNQAVEWGFLKSSPAHKLKVEGKPVERDRFLNQDELEQFIDALAQEDDYFCDFFLLALLTGARRANVCAMHWNETDLKLATWRIPRTKNGDPQTVLLSPPAVAILRARQEKYGGKGYLLNRWKAEGLSTGTLKNRMAAMRTWAKAVGKPELIPQENTALGIASRQYVGQPNKAQRLDGEKLAKITDPYVHMTLRLETVFGLRREEGIKIRPSIADKGNVLKLKGSWCKNGRPRTIPIRTAEQRAVLDEAHRLAGRGALIPAHKSYDEQKNIYKSQLRAANLRNMHGLRHQYAQDRYQELTGWKCPKAGGPARDTLTPEQRKVDTAAREAVSQELGHNRIEIVARYTG